MKPVARIARISGAVVHLDGPNSIRPGDVLGASPESDGSRWRSGRLRVVEAYHDGRIVLRESAWTQVPAICHTDYLYRAPTSDDDVAVAADLLEHLGHTELAERLRTRLAVTS